MSERLCWVKKKMVKTLLGTNKTRNTQHTRNISTFDIHRRFIGHTLAVVVVAVAVVAEVVAVVVQLKYF